MMGHRPGKIGEVVKKAETFSVHLINTFQSYTVAVDNTFRIEYKIQNIEQYKITTTCLL